MTDHQDINATAVLAAIEQIGTGDLAGRFTDQVIGMGFDGLTFEPVGPDGKQLDGCYAYFSTSWGGDEPSNDGTINRYVNTANNDVSHDRTDNPDHPRYDDPDETIARWVIEQAQTIRPIWQPSPGTNSG